MSRQFLRKPHSGRRGRRDGLSHWLEQGSYGQEALFFDLDPYLLAIDQALCSRATQLAFRLRADRKRRRMLLIPVPGVVGWQTGFFSKQFEIFICGMELDLIAEAAAEKFNASLLMSFDELPESAADIIVFLDTNWAGAKAFEDGIRYASEFLYLQGELLVVVACELTNDGPQVIWRDSSTASLEVQSKRLSKLQDHSFRGIATERISTVDYVNMAPTFLKRHRDFFGRNTRDLYLERVNDSDFVPRASGIGDRAVALLGWGPADAPLLSPAGKIVHDTQEFD